MQVELANRCGGWPSSIMKASTLFLSLLTVFAAATPAVAQPHHGNRGESRAHAGRSHGVFARPQGRRAGNARRYSSFRNPRTGRFERHAIVYDHRPAYEIRHDRYARVWRPGYRPRYGWGHFHPTGGWFTVWGINSWAPVSTVTCEAANEITGELYPVTAGVVPSGWSNAGVDAILDQALDECAAAAGANVCVPVQPACSYGRY